MCRRVFFPAQPRLHTAYGTVAVDGSDTEDSDDEQTGLDRLVSNIEWSSRQLDLSPEACRLSVMIGRRAFGLDVVRHCSRMEKAAMSVFVASHFVGHAVTLEQISQAVGLSRRTINDTYRLFYPARRAVIDGALLLLLGEDPAGATTGSLPPLAWPRPEYANAFWEMIAERLSLIQEHSLIEVSRLLFLKLVDKPYFNAENILNIIALSIYLASYLNNTPPIPVRKIALVTGVSVSQIQVTHALFYPHRKDLLENRAVWMNDSFERLVDDLPWKIVLPLWE